MTNQENRQLLADIKGLKQRHAAELEAIIDSEKRKQLRQAGTLEADCEKLKREVAELESELRDTKSECTFLRQKENRSSALVEEEQLTARREREDMRSELMERLVALLCFAFVYGWCFSWLGSAFRGICSGIVSVALL